MCTHVHGFLGHSENQWLTFKKKNVPYTKCWADLNMLVNTPWPNFDVVWSTLAGHSFITKKIQIRDCTKMRLNHYTKINDNQTFNAIWYQIYKKYCFQHKFRPTLGRNWPSTMYLKVTHEWSWDWHLLHVPEYCH